MVACLECGNPIPQLPVDRQYIRSVTCSIVCKKARHLKQVKANNEKNRKPKVAKKCEICDDLFIPKNSFQKYCGKQSCKDEGLRRAVARQTVRRENSRLIAKQYREFFFDPNSE